MMDEKPKVHAVIDKKVTTIDQETGTHRVDIKGTFNGLGSGLRDYIMKGGKSAKADITVNTGQYPAGHDKEGKWAIQIMIDAFDTEEEAATLADRIAPKLKGMVSAAPSFTPMPAHMLPKDHQG